MCPANSVCFVTIYRFFIQPASFRSFRSIELTVYSILRQRRHSAGDSQYRLKKVEVEVESAPEHKLYQVYWFDNVSSSGPLCLTRYPMARRSLRIADTEVSRIYFLRF